MPSPRRSHAVSLLATSVLVAAGSGCATAGAGDEPALEVRIVARDWNGWDPDHRSTPDERVVAAAEGASTTFTCVGDLEVAVEDVDDAAVTLAFSSALARTGESGGVDFGTTVDSVGIALDEPVTLMTPTTDAGCSFELEVRRA